MLEQTATGQFLKNPSKNNELEWKILRILVDIFINDDN